MSNDINTFNFFTVSKVDDTVDGRIDCLKQIIHADDIGKPL